MLKKKKREITQGESPSASGEGSFEKDRSLCGHLPFGHQSSSVPGLNPAVAISLGPRETPQLPSEVEGLRTLESLGREAGGGPGREEFNPDSSLGTPLLIPTCSNARHPFPYLLETFLSCSYRAHFQSTTWPSFKSPSILTKNWGTGKK